MKILTAIASDLISQSAIIYNTLAQSLLIFVITYFFNKNNIIFNNYLMIIIDRNYTK